jgi:hypothetical protein
MRRSEGSGPYPTHKVQTDFLTALPAAGELFIHARIAPDLNRTATSTTFGMSISPMLAD